MRRFFHGTTTESYLELLDDPHLSLERASARRNDTRSRIGFSLGTRKLPCVYLGILHNDDIRLLRYEMEPAVLAFLLAAGAELEAVPQGGAFARLEGSELFIPPECFDIFNEELDVGGITVETAPVPA